MSTRFCRSLLCDIELCPMKSLLPEPFSTVSSSAPWEAEGRIYEKLSGEGENPLCLMTGAQWSFYFFMRFSLVFAAFGRCVPRQGRGLVWAHGRETRPELLADPGLPSHPSVLPSYSYHCLCGRPACVGSRSRSRVGIPAPAFGQDKLKIG
jgi:hypothetical protein